MLQSEAEEPRFVARRHAGGSRGNGDALQADHFAHDATARIGSGHQHRVQIQSSGGDDLQVAEQGVCGCVAAGEEDTQPSEQRTEEREEDSGSGECQAESRGGAAVIQQKCQGQYRGDGNQWQCKLACRRATTDLPNCAGDMPSANAAKMQANIVAVPEAVKKLKLNSAG